MIIFCMIRVVFVTKQKAAEHILIFRLTALYPAEYRSISNIIDMFAVRNQMAERCAIGKRGILAGRRIHALLPPIGTKRRCIERYQ